MQWHYLTDTQEKKLIDEAQLPELVCQGVVRHNTLVWSEFLTEWTKAGIVKPELFFGTAGQPPATTPVAICASRPGEVATGEGNSVTHYRELARILSKASGWLRFLGVLNFIVFFYIITIFIGIKCFTIASAADEASRSGDYSQLRKAVKAVSDLFLLQGVITLIALVINVFYLLLLVANA